MSDIQEIQDKLFNYYKHQEKHYDLDEDTIISLGIDWSIFYNKYNEIFTPVFFFKLCMLKNPNSTLEEAFIAGFNKGFGEGGFKGFFDGYSEGLNDADNLED